LTGQFFEVAVSLRPKFIIYENVASVVTYDNGLFAQKAIMQLLQQGYQLTLGVLNAANFGVPQQRRR
jgi:DNA (cytosine-5)-methyltransferase 1